MLSAESSSEPGQWKTDRAPYQREPMDVVSDPTIEVVTLMTSAQVGKTEIINNVIGFHIDKDPAPMLVIQPTLEIGASWSKDRFSPMVRDTACLRSKVHNPKSRVGGNTLLYKKFNGGHLTVAGANSPASLASRPVRIVLFDEVDRYPASAGTEGDPISLGKKRADTFWNHVIIETSTPTIDGISRIQRSYEASDQRHYYVECQGCRKKHLLEWKNVVWEKDENGKHLPETAAHACPECGYLASDADLPMMLKNGEWRKHQPEVTGHAGFHLNELYSPWVRFGKTVKDFLESKDNPELLKTWTNTALGEVWEEAKNIGDINTLYARRENYDATLIPFGGVVLTAGIDVQDNRVEMEVIAWGKNRESWGIEYVILPGDPAKPDVWEALDTRLMKTYDHESGFKLRIVACGIDTGGHHTQGVYSFCKPRWGRNVFAIKGAGGQGKPMASRPSKNNQGKVNLFTVGTDTAKDTLLSCLSQREPGPGYCHFPMSYDTNYFGQLLSERPVIHFVRGHRVRTWELSKRGARNEALDCRVYAMAALDILGIDLNATVERFHARLGGSAGQQVNAPQSGIRKHRVRSAGYGRDYLSAG